MVSSWRAVSFLHHARFPPTPGASVLCCALATQLRSCTGSALLAGLAGLSTGWSWSPPRVTALPVSS
eukprot:5161307-Lingulodinium_polyedra.AAC.1